MADSMWGRALRGLGSITGRNDMKTYAVNFLKSDWPEMIVEADGYEIDYISAETKHTRVVFYIGSRSVSLSGEVPSFKVIQLYLLDRNQSLVIVEK